MEGGVLFLKPSPLYISICIFTGNTMAGEFGLAGLQSVDTMHGRTES